MNKHTTHRQTAEYLGGIAGHLVDLSNPTYGHCEFNDKLNKLMLYSIDYKLKFPVDEPYPNPINRFHMVARSRAERQFNNLVEACDGWNQPEPHEPEKLDRGTCWLQFMIHNGEGYSNPHHHVHSTMASAVEQWDDLTMGFGDRAEIERHPWGNKQAITQRFEDADGDSMALYTLEAEINLVYVAIANPDMCELAHVVPFPNVAAAREYLGYLLMQVEPEDEMDFIQLKDDLFRHGVTSAGIHTEDGYQHFFILRS